MRSKVDTHITVMMASQGDANVVAVITDAAYSKYITRIGRKPEPMTVDYGDMISEYPVHILMVDDRPAGVLVLKHEADQTLIWSVAVHPEYQGRGLGLRLSEASRAGGTHTRLQKDPALHERPFHREHRPVQVVRV